MRKTCDPSTLGCSEVWHSRKNNVALLVGDKRNASAALYGLPLKGYDVKHVICVGNQGTVEALQKLPMEFTKPPQAPRLSFSSGSSESTSTCSDKDDEGDLEVNLVKPCSSDKDDEGDLEVNLVKTELVEEESELVMENTTYRLGKSACQFTPCPMNDTMVASARVELERDCAEQLTAVCTAIKKLEDCSQDRQRAVLLHCDQGRNRSPTVAMAFLMLDGASLRSAYRRVLAVRESIDPLRPYREALKRMEIYYRGKCSVHPDDHFALHISDINAKEAEEVSAEAFGRALSLRIKSIAKLKRTCSSTSNHSEKNHRQPWEREQD